MIAWWWVQSVVLTAVSCKLSAQHVRPANTGSDFLTSCTQYSKKVARQFGVACQRWLAAYSAESAATRIDSIPRKPCDRLILLRGAQAKTLSVQSIYTNLPGFHPARTTKDFMDGLNLIIMDGCRAQALILKR